MKDIDLKKHHAYLVLSRNGNGLNLIEAFLKTHLDFETVGNPDYWKKEIETFGIEDSRELKEVHLRKSFKEGGEKVFVVKNDFITHEAQNSLLKILEDPTPNSFFFFLMPSKENLLPTLISRFMVLEKMNEDPDDAINQELPFEIDYFLKLSAPARLKAVSKIVSAKDKGQAQKIIDALENYFHQKIDWQKAGKNDLEIFETFISSRRFLKSQGGSIKLILENLCLNLPRI